MKRLLFGVLAALLCAACSNEESTLDIRKEGGLNVELKLSASTEANTRTAYSVATEAERTVKTLDAYLFAPAAETQDYVLEKKYNNLLSDSWTPATLEDSKTVTLSGVSRTAKKIFFVANGTDIASLKVNAVAGMTEAAFRALLMNAMTANPEVTEASPLPMTAEASVAADAWNGNPLSVTVSAVALERVVARIDLAVKAQEGVLFVPSKLEMVNARPNSFIFPSEGNYADGSATLKLEQTIAAATSTTSEAAYYNSLLYPYEAPATDNVKLVVTGKLTVGGKTVLAAFDLPFVDADGNQLAVERNTRYLVTITKINGLDATVDVTFTVSDWEDGGTIEHPVQVDNFIVTGDGLTGNKLTLAQAESSSAQLTVTTNVAWKAEVTKGTDFLTATPSGNTLTIAAISANESGAPRKAYVELSTDADPNVTYTLVVTQAAE
ncbi:fimbrial protein [Bacteroides sp. ET489]|uniref:fimbrial protein n=1 Tax=Bacteroides sp. ET489 TaxID=3057126 RepID=UPI0026741055|nr:fimbrial protein [Bacteroides sp. ET489]MDO3389436.1 fimbrial protein [Bacteroides sp. ET489]